jgi:membrane associated rhomboid family serine protease
MDMRDTNFKPPGRERIFNVPLVVLVLIALLGLVHAYVVLALTGEQTDAFLLMFAFIPARYDPTVMSDIVWPGGWAADIWTFVTYAFIHGDVSHLVFNVVWLLAFGSPVARRLGTARFLLFMALGAVAGAAVHLAMHFGSWLPMVGASASISAAMAAAIRFAFQPGEPLALWRDPEAVYRVPAAPLAQGLRDRRVIAFLLVWAGANFLFGWLGSVGMGGIQQAIAWEAHVGGFVFGLLAFAVFDPIPIAGKGNRKDGQTSASS